MSPSKLNVLSNYLNFAVVAVVGLVVNPLLLGFLGPATFGIWKACQRFLDFATVADGRATQALKWVVAHRSGTNTPEDNQRDVGATIVVWLLWLPVLLIISTALTFALPSLIRDLDPASSDAVMWIGAILSANVVLTGLIMIPDSVLVGTNQGYRSMLLTTLVLVLSNLAMLAVAWLGYGPIALAGVVLIAAVINGALTYLVARRKVPWLGVKRPNRSDVGRLAKFSGWVLTWSFVNKLMLSTEVVLLSTMVGAVAVTNFTFTGYVAQFAVAIAFMTTSAFMPKLGILLGKGELEAARTVMVETRELNLALITVTGAGMLLFNRPFVTLWAGAQHYMGDAINALIVVAFVQLSLIRWAAQVQDTGLAIRGKVLLGAVGAIGSLVAAGAVFMLTHSIEWMYAALITARLVLNVAYPIMVNKLMRLPTYGLSFGSLRGYTAMIIVLVAAYLLAPWVNTGDWLSVFFGAAITVGVLGAVSYFVILSPPTRIKLRLSRSSARRSGA